MSSLQEIVDRHPVHTGLVGTLTGIGTSFLYLLHIAAGIAADVGMMLGCAASGLTVALLYDRWKYRRTVRLARLARARRELEAQKDSLP